MHTGERLGRLVAAGRVVASALPVDTNPVPSWTHLTKVDPEDDKRLPLLYPRYLRWTDAVAVGGSTAVTPTNTEATFALLSAVDRPVFHEPSDPTHVTDRTMDAAAFIAIPQVLNGSTDAIVGDLGAGIERVRERLAPAMVEERVPWWTPGVVRDALADAATTWLLATAAFEAYVVQNPDSAAAREAGVTAEDVLGPAEAARRAMVADRYLRAPVVYIEYSGTFGGMDAERVVEAVDGAVSRSRVWYGGGLASRDDARAMLEAGADAVVVGDAFHEIASEERAIFDRARDALPDDASRATVADWLSDAAAGDTAAAAYLSTVPGVADPTATAGRLLVDTVTVWLRLRAVAAGTASDAALDRAVSAAGVRGAGPAEADEAARRWSRAALGAVGGSATEPLATQLSPAGDR
ncbi:heptaprenylglyceryl phosphate synthase [Salinigranum marinum]|uniref:heptaprenylglyceryl phosphate synthase n=1 Tax=Salinigranum marinum TaxID=1515595 RepID=UPI002989F1FC|nr:heptaprenylglyceryl phosphate synthase [Salinigranum marinum]